MSTATDLLVRSPVPWTRRALVRRAVGRSGALAIGGTLVTIFMLCGLIGLVLLLLPHFKGAWYDQDLSNALKRPLSAGHLLGTDSIGRDLLARTLAGIGVSFTIGFAVTIISLVIGMVMGLLAGYYKGWLDTVISGVIDVSWGFPVILLAVMLAGIIGPGFKSIILAVGLLNWAGFARIIRGYALSLREREFVEAARALGIPSWRIITTHLLPNVVAPTLVMASYYVAVTIIVESGLSFLGLGVQPPTPSLGQMLADGRDFLRLAPWQVLLPALVVGLAVFGFNVLGDGLRDVLDPRLSRPQA